MLHTDEIVNIMDKEQAISEATTRSFYEWAVYLYYIQPIIAILLAMNVLDIITGTIASGMKGKVSSKIGFSGMMRKTMMLLMVGMAAAIQQIQPEVPLVKATCFMFIYVEAVSVIGNARRAGVPIPDVLYNAIKHGELMNENKSKEVHLKINEANIDATILSDVINAEEKRKP